MRPRGRNMRMAAVGGGVLIAAAALAACLYLYAARDGGADLASVYQTALGGDTTRFSAGRNAFDLSAHNLTNEERRVFEIGDSFFEQNWVTAQASTAARDGLGPTFNAQSCSSCHADDGRARPPSGDDDPVRGLLLRLSVPGPDGPQDVPAYGGQLQDRAILGVVPEGALRIRYDEIEGAYPDGTPFSLRRPTYSVANPAFGEPPDGLMTSPRIAPANIGMGLLEAIPESRILALADPEDADGDGISGRPNTVWDARADAPALGRFGWKAGQPTVELQTANAFLHDIGITSDILPAQNCPPAQTACQAAPDGGSPEISEDRLAKVTFYTSVLAVPAMRGADDPQVKRGARAFAAANCVACHVPRHETADDHPLRPARGQVIFPYTDLLLHDMGEGLADGRPDGLATGSEWRTPPLWGIGLVETVNGHTNFLHDGRARNLEEAILWHGGEAEKSRDAFMDMPKGERAALIEFLKSI